MIIIKYDGNVNDGKINSSDMAIATTMFNIETGKRVFDIRGNIDRPDDDFNTITKGGITYSIHLMKGSLLFTNIGPVGGIFLSTIIKKIRSIIDRLHLRYNELKGGVRYYTANSIDFVAESTLVKRVSYRKIGTSGTGTTNTFTWTNRRFNKEDIDIRRCYCNNRAEWEYNHIYYHNAIVVDLINIFNTPDHITIIHDKPELSHFVMSSRVVCTGEVYFNNKLGGIYPTLQHLNGIKYIDKDENHNEVGHIFQPIYEEQWCNINPMRAKRMDVDSNLSVHINKLLEMDYDFNLMELEEIKNVQSGAPPTPNDRCNSCYMYLYDSIYVMESGDNHVCVCGVCYHAYLTSDDVNTHVILKVKYPRTVVEVIDMTPLGDYDRDMLVELSTEYQLKNLSINASEISSKNYHGTSVLNAVLMKQIDTHAMKKLFKCVFI